jgi:hypothetical protein
VRHYGRSVAAAAKHDERDDDDPAAAVIAAEKPAKTIIVHTKSSFKDASGSIALPRYYFMRMRAVCDRSVQIFHDFCPPLDNPPKKHYNGSVAMATSAKSMNTVPRKQRIARSPPCKSTAGEDEESTVQIRHNSHYRNRPAAEVGMLIVPCRKRLSGKGEAITHRTDVPAVSLPYCSPRSPDRGGLFTFILFANNAKRG